MSDNSRIRVSIVGVVIVALFCSLVARLWFLQMGPEQKLKAEAIALSTRRVATPSARGRILDRNGVVLAQDRIAWAVTVDRNMKKAARTRVLGQLSEQLGIPQKTLQERFDSPRQSPLKPAVVALDLSVDDRLAILQRQDEYPGVHVEQLSVRSYPEAQKLNDPTLAAHVLGYVGEISDEQLKKYKAKGYQLGDIIGREGVESAYEQYLHGRPEIDTVQVDPTGRQIGAPIDVQRGSVGDDVYLTIDADIQHAAEQALQGGIDFAHTLHDNTKTGQPNAKLAAPAGSVVVLDARDGSVVAMASNPAFPPDNWVGGLKQSDADMLNNPASHTPLLNRATEGQYAPGSTFKLVSGTALTHYNLRGLYQTYDDTGVVHIGNQNFFNDNQVSNGPVDLQTALTKSSDTYFYTAGSMFWQAWHNGDLNVGLGLQTEAHLFGFGAKTGVELSELPGTVPDPTWKQKLANAEYKDDAQKRHEYGLWEPGDDVHIATGQGGLNVTPLQLADAYGAFANDGTLWTPHVGMKVVDSTGATVNTIKPKALGTVPLDPTVRQVMVTGFKNVTQDPTGTAYFAFQGFPQSSIPGGVAGKTGTAQVDGKAPTSVFASFFPADAPQYVVIAMVEEGGHGAQIAAPIVRQIIEHIVNPKAPPTPISQVSGND